VNVLRVWSKDVAGRFSTAVEYRFRVRPGDGPVAQWLFDDPEAAGEDNTGHGNTAGFYSGAATGTGRAGVGSAVSLDGSNDLVKTDGSLTRPHPDTGAPVVVRTDETFTVAAWVKLDTTGPAPTAVSVDGTRNSAFMLGYSESANRWRFVVTESDTDSSKLPSAFSNTAPVTGRWTHLAGTYDKATGTIRLYVNGVAQNSSATVLAGFHASGPLVIGRRILKGVHSEYFDGQVDDVRFYSFLPQVGELVEAARPLPPAVSFPDGDTAQVGGTLRLRFNAAGDTNIISFKYSVGTDALNQTVTLGTAGGTATVTVPVSVAGELPVFAASVDRVAHVSESATAIATVLGDPEVSGVVYDEVTREPVAGATVMLDQAELSLTTGAGGEFSFDGFEAGTYTLAAHLGGQCGMATATELEIASPVLVELWLTPAKDGFGYECQEAPGTPFTPIGGSVLPLTADDAVAQVTLPFAFPFYGEQHTTAWVDTNGYLTFADPGTSHPAGEGTLPSPSEPNSLIAAFWDDLVVDGAASVRTASAGSAPFRTFTIEWRDVHLAGDTTARLSVQAILFEGGFVHLAYSGLESAAERGQGAVVGLESPGGQLGVQYSYRQSVLASDLLIVFAYPAEPNPISAVTLSGTVVDSATGEPAAGVDVLLDPAEQSVTTGADGGFAFTELEWGSYVVEAKTLTHCGKAGQAYVELESSEQVQVDLVPAADEYGYTCAAGPRSFLATSTTLALSGDDSNRDVSLPFPFTLYGESYSQVWVNTNGLLIFAPQGFPWYDPHEIPSVHYSPSSAVYGFWSDWEVDALASVRTGITGSAPNRRFVVEWRNVVHRQNSSARVSFQVVLHETSNQVSVAWKDIGGNALERGADAVVGIENVDGTIALPYQEFDQAIASGQGVLFSPGDPGMHELSGETTCAGNPVAGVNVRVGELTTVTDAAGGFEFTGVPPGPQGLVASAASGPCAGSVSMPVAAVRGEPQFVEVAMNPVADAVGYTVTRPATSMLAANTAVSLPGTDGGDDEVVQVTPPFPVKLYGQTYSQAWVDTNGYLMFANRGFSDPLPFPIPSVEWSPDAAVYPFWNDWVVDSLASVRTGVHGSAPNRQWVVEWRNVHPFNMWQRVNFQVVFEETSGKITFSYSGIDSMFVERGGAGLTGVENADSTTAIEYSYLSPVLRTGRGLVLTPTGS
jgi:hypothetical protein